MMSPRAMRTQQVALGKQLNLQSDFSKGTGTTKDAKAYGAIVSASGPSRTTTRNKSASSLRSHQNSYAGLVAFNNNCTSGNLHRDGSSRPASTNHFLQSTAMTSAPDVSQPERVPAEARTASDP